MHMVLIYEEVFACLDGSPGRLVSVPCRHLIRRRTLQDSKITLSVQITST